MKKRKLTLLITILSILAMISVGFAAWVITNNADAQDTGNVRVDVVSDKRLGITAAIKDEANVVFGAKEKSSNIEYDWLKYEDSELNENLTIYVVITIENYTYLEADKAIEISLAEKEGQSVYAKALEKNYVAELPHMEISYDDLLTYASEQDDDSITCEIPVVFNWGSKFDEVNPIDYFNSSEYSKELGDEAFTVLQELHALDEAQYVLTVEAFTK